MLRLGTRQSALARAQADQVANRLRAVFPELELTLVPMTTTGDLPVRLRITLQPGEGGAKALFTKELEEALLAGRIDLAVHSMKDMAAEPPPGLGIGAVPARDDPRDVWIAKDGRPLHEARHGARLGTGSIRRQVQLRHFRPDLELVPIRGNVDTRLRKLREGDLDGLVLALAGLRRLGRAGEATETLPTDVMLPAAGQGALAIEIRQSERLRLARYLEALDDPPTRHATEAERAFLGALGGNCQTPVAAYAQVSGQAIAIEGLVATTDGRTVTRERESGSVTEAKAVGARLAQRLMARQRADA
jgi:hydroxymethylbilane synthase